MAPTTIHTPVAGHDAHGILSRVAAMFTWMAGMSAAARAGRHAGELAQLTDAQLAARGLTRDGIVAHAFRDLTGC